MITNHVTKASYHRLNLLQNGVVLDGCSPTPLIGDVIKLGMERIEPFYVRVTFVKDPEYYWGSWHPNNVRGDFSDKYGNALDEIHVLLDNAKRKVGTFVLTFRDYEIRKTSIKYKQGILSPYDKYFHPLHGYVYLMQDAKGLYKIGRSSDPEFRQKQLSRKANPVQLICVIAHPDSKLSLEQDLHKIFASKRIKGEWFALLDGDVEYIKFLAGDGI